MSTPSIHNESSGHADDAQVSEHDGPISLAALLRPVEAVAFWSAIALPFLYLPLLVSGLSTTAQTTAFIALLVLHVVTVIGGHHYKRE